MKVGFKPQKLMHNIALEQVLENGNAIRRVIEVPGKNAKTIDLTYRKTDFLPTQWYVANYNVISRDGQKGIIKSFDNDKKSPTETHVTLKRFYDKAVKETKIDIVNGVKTQKSNFKVASAKV